jgi:ATP-dependent Clp protease ATP-binding subunit ClpA
MFERFTDRARQSLVLAQEEARDLQHGYIGTEHILLGLLRESEGVGARSLRRLGVRLDGARSEVEALIGRGTETPSGHIPFTPRAKKVLELSLREAIQLGHNYIGTEHIVLGLVREGDGVAAQTLVKLGAALDRVRATVLDEVGRAGAEQRTTGDRRTPAAEEAMATAQELASGAPMGSHHLLEALARSDESLAGKVLAALGVDPDAVAAKIDELGVDGTTDVTPEEAAARHMEVRLEGDEVHLVLRDETSVELVGKISAAVGGPVRSEDVGSLVGLWQASVGGLEELRRRVAPLPDEADSGPRRSAIVRQAIENRLARRRRDR